ncbi:MAG: DNA mismatch repair protein MutS [Dehalococcoidales bacterium]|jgi:DNA mismatch repair protein MutS|nr:DNA mismatch repair protein MutS [Dehalococcoidales bacterium]MDP6737829.1 DNA mismatch repair protein MutS [Dehalococcoidales bacterium]|tara:strand:- start:2060 stop:4642 length:2583 start_codon:yes stop_codon:yes gene_type:complete
MRECRTPIRQQYLDIKHKYPQTIVFFRLGDFYETFDEDAQVIAKELGIVLTSREMGKGHRIPMAGIPYHALDSYLGRLVNHGHKIAICEQLTEPGETKGIIDREVVRVVTPGTIVDPNLLDSKRNNYLTALVLGTETAGIAYVDITTSDFATTQLSLAHTLSELERVQPSEIIAPEGANLTSLELSAPVTRLNDYWFEPETAQKTLLDYFGATTLDDYGCAHLPLAISAAGAIVHYIQETQKGSIGQLMRPTTYSTETFMLLDEQTQRNLELFRKNPERGRDSLLSVIDLTKTMMGSRLLKRWLGQPLLDITKLSRRQDSIGWFYENALARNETITLLTKMSDLERLINRVRNNIVIPRELVALRSGLEMIPRLITIMDGSPDASTSKELKPYPETVDLIAQAIADEPSSGIGENSVIRKGFSEELDNIRLASQNARQYLANLERQEQEKTGIKSLKVGYNRVFGYYIEISKHNLPQVPQHYIRRQTLAGGERFFTPELKEYESLILNARDQISELEWVLFRRVCHQVALSSEHILATADAIAHIDVLSSLAETAVRQSYIRPKLTMGQEITIKEGRHPVVERNLLGSSFVPNDTYLASHDTQLIVLTGPNMAGKSTYLKQVALIILLAQIGSFVPAASATIGLVDRIFTRVGAGEDIAAGQSTFMVEMIETANILNNATPRSVIILDEIGRGTSTYDGLAIAQAVVEYLHNHPTLGAKTLFATHYHEMVELANYLPRVKNFNVAVTEDKGEIIFLRKILPGGVDRSYGIYVAQLAGLPKPVVHRAQEVLEKLEEDKRKTTTVPSPQDRRPKTDPQQLPLLGQKPPLLAELEKLDINSITPLEALTKLYELQKKAKEKEP